jgi:general L-amino acid transport system substrate-binding protein
VTADRQWPVVRSFWHGRGSHAAPALMAFTIFCVLTLLTTLAAPQAAAATLDDVRTRGHLVCGVSEGMPGFATVSPAGAWTGLDVDFCAAVAAAVLGNKGAVKYRVVSPSNRFQALASGEVDLLPRANGLTLSRDTETGARFVDTLFHDGQGFLVRRGHAVASVLELSGASVCVLNGAGVQGLEDFSRARRMRFQRMVAAEWAEAVKSYADGACTVLTGDITVLAAERSRLATPGEHVILPELVSKEMLGPFVRQGDEQWFSVVRWTLDALIAAEELGISVANAEAMRSEAAPDVRRFLGLEADLGAPLGLARGWSYEIVRQVGNYGEIFERNIGLASPLALERGVNNLWTRGGLLSAGSLR